MSLAMGEKIEMDGKSRPRALNIIMAVVALSMSMLACGRHQRRAEAGLNKISGEVEFENETREYTLLTPSDLDQTASYPLVLALHGGGGDGQLMCALKGGIQELAAEHEFLVLCPSGVDEHWNDGREIDTWRAHAEKINDVGFLMLLVDDIAESYPVDTDRIFVTGMSNGGKMSLRLACETEGVFQAAAPVIATLPADLACQPVDQISILLMNGSEDPLAPWEGGQVIVFGRSLGVALSTNDTLRLWADHNQCDPKPLITHLPDLTENDESYIELRQYQGCREGLQVMLYKVHGGGHTWPGGSQYLPSMLIGRTNQDAHAGQLIWDFFVSSTE